MTSNLRPSFIGLVRAEVRKIVLQRTTWLILGAALLVFAVVALGLSSASSFRHQLALDPTSWFEQMVEILYLTYATGAGIFLLIVGARMVSMEYASGTIRIVLARGVGRLQLLSAKLVALALIALVLLAAFTLLATAFLLALVHTWTGSLSTLTALPALARGEVWGVLEAASVSMAVCILLALAAGVVGRAPGFALGFALGLFPADNFGTIILALLGRATGQTVWLQISQWLLGPNLNYLLHVLEPGIRIRIAFAAPLVAVDAHHVAAVITVWALALLGTAVYLTWRRDVLE
ncbi:MAG TPA: ABC transporter permease [Candidatus Nitrosotalea sp.]|nr:ABC transporter permease [Candidatus Nitrosotalea sp.]